MAGLFFLEPDRCRRVQSWLVLPLRAALLVSSYHVERWLI